MQAMSRFRLSLLLFPFCFSACKKDVPAFVVTQVDGIVKDAETGLPQEGVTVSIMGENFVLFSGPRWHDLPDKDTTGADGRFSIRFPSDGHSKSFMVTAASQDDPRFHHGSETALRTRRYNLVELTVRRSHVIKLHLEVQQNPFDTMFVSAGAPGSLLTGRTVDTTLYQYFTRQDRLLFSAVVQDRSIPGQRQYKENIVLPSPLPDTFSLNISLGNTADFPVVQ